MAEDKPRLIGISGTFASGKDSLADYLVENYGFFHMSTSDALRREKRRRFGDGPEGLLRRGDPFANKLRQEKGPGVLIDLAHGNYKKQRDKYPGGAVITAIRAIGEVERVKELGGTMVFVDADAKIRYGRAFSRGRDTQDKELSFEQFLASEKGETPADNSDKTLQNLRAMKEMADIVLINESDMQSFFDRAIERLGLKNNG